eukprot:Amastigsp_a845136_49.p7 type:complete len:135 gc:universal Amastigsp_a845136_49:427-23(-)
MRLSADNRVELGDVFEARVDNEDVAVDANPAAQSHGCVVGRDLARHDHSKRFVANCTAGAPRDLTDRVLAAENKDRPRVVEKPAVVTLEETPHKVLAGLDRHTHRIDVPRARPQLIAKPGRGGPDVAVIVQSKD